ncbi:hypothetical protein PVAP13_3KG062800 [Panicum virgatum]|uniref:Uncharacterized protein n=1 Tax=Panicum virgatum TaxID=38727 RepID=A0A8T0URE0_PANVG|nr:hypothetical protein PVAP13_3KG062800 [Panicum virgatum]
MSYCTPWLMKLLQPDMCTVFQREKREVDETTAETLQKHQTQVSQVTLTVEYQQESYRVMTSVQPARAPCPEFSIQEHSKVLVPVGRRR